MNLKLQRLLHLDDARIKKSGRLYGYGSVIFGGLLMLGSPAWYFLFQKAGEMNVTVGKRFISGLLEVVEPGSKAHLLTLDMESTLPRFLGAVADFGFTFSLLFGGLGLSLVGMGMLYFRLHESISEPDEGGNSE